MILLPQLPESYRHILPCLAWGTGFSMKRTQIKIPVLLNVKYFGCLSNFQTFLIPHSLFCENRDSKILEEGMYECTLLAMWHIKNVIVNIW
jgi:hypothetical protein